MKPYIFFHDRTPTDTVVSFDMAQFPGDGAAMAHAAALFLRDAYPAVEVWQAARLIGVAEPSAPVAPWP